MKPIWIELVNKGVANRFDLKDHELIEMNWRLTMYPELYQRVFQHEIGHEEGQFKFKDFMHDMKSKTPGLMNFMSKHISSWTQILPFYWDLRRDKLVYDISSIVSWIMIISTTVFVFYFLRWLI